jgi:hypothetical protein
MVKSLVGIDKNEYDALRAENESLKVDNHTLKLKLEDIQATWGAVCEDLEAKIAIATEALKFYSSEWRSDVYVGPTTEMLNDFGKLATETLEKLQEQEAQREEK